MHKVLESKKVGEQEGMKASRRKKGMNSWPALFIFLANLRHGYTFSCVLITHSVYPPYTRSA